MKPLFNKISLTILVCLCMTLSGCGFHFRCPSDWPRELRTLYFATDNVYQGVTAELMRRFHAFHVQLLNSPLKAPLQLLLSNSHFTTNMPILFDSNIATTYTYTLSVDLTLIDAKGHTVEKTTVLATKSVTNNMNQVSPPVVTPLMRRRLTEQLVNNIMTQISSVSLVKALKK